MTSLGTRLTTVTAGFKRPAPERAPARNVEAEVRSLLYGSRPSPRLRPSTWPPIRDGAGPERGK